MTNAQIQSFCAVAKDLNMSSAAEEIHVSQPVISRQIRALEEELGFRLFERGHRRLSMTESGRMMYEFFSGYLSELESTATRARYMAEHRPKTISIALLELFDSAFILSAMRRFNADFKDTNFYVERHITPRFAQDLASGIYDVMITFNDLAEKIEGVRFAPIFDCVEYVVVSQSHPLSALDRLTLEDLRTEKLCMTGNLEYNTGSRLMNNGLLKYMGLDKCEAIRMPNQSSVLATVESGLAYTILEQSVLPFVKFPHKRLRIQTPHRFSCIGVAWRERGDSSVLAAFNDYLRQEMLQYPWHEFDSDWNGQEFLEIP